VGDVIPAPEKTDGTLPTRKRLQHRHEQVCAFPYGEV